MRLAADHYDSLSGEDIEHFVALVVTAFLATIVEVQDALPELRNSEERRLRRPRVRLNLNAVLHDQGHPIPPILFR